MQDALDLIRDSRRILLSGHLRADGDCIGSISVLYHALRALGKEPLPLLPDPPDDRYGFVREHTPWSVYDGELPEADLLVVSDCNQLERLGEMGAAVAARGMKRIAVDHHPIPGDQGWDALVHDEQAASAGLLALELGRALGADPLPREAYAAAFVSLMTDTGWLKYSNADLRAWTAAADLVERGGLDTERLYNRIYQQAEPERPAGIAAVLGHLEYHCAQEVAVAWAGRADLEAAGGTVEDTDEVLDLLRAVRTVEAVAVVTERPGGRVKVSFRSKSWLDVNHVARTVGGGGHARAAGASFAEGLPLEACVERARRALVEAWTAGRG